MNLSTPDTSPAYFYTAFRAGMPRRPIPSVQPLDATEVRISVAGLRFAGHQAVADSVVVGERVVLRREPENVYDANAVAVHREDGRRFGYLPGAMAAVLAPRLDQTGTPLTAVVASTPPFKTKPGVKSIEVTFTPPVPPTAGSCEAPEGFADGEVEGE